MDVAILVAGELVVHEIDSSRIEHVVLEKRAGTRRRLPLMVVKKRQRRLPLMVVKKRLSTREKSQNSTTITFDGGEEKA